MMAESVARLFTVDEVAERFRVSRRTFQAHIRQHPYYRQMGRRKLFTEADIQRLYEALPCPSNSSVDTEAQTSTCAVASGASLWTRAQALLTESSPNKFALGANGSSSRRASSDGKVRRRS